MWTTSIRTFSLLQISIFILLFPVAGLPQADAGKDKANCNNEGVEIGTTGTGKDCYFWEPAEGLDDRTKAMPMANPASTTEYTLFVTKEDFSLKSMDKVKVFVTDDITIKVPSFERLGFDDFSEPDILWASVRENSSDALLVEIRPEDSAEGVYFKSLDESEVTVFPDRAREGNQLLTLIGQDNGETEVEINCGDTDGHNLKRLNVACYPLNRASVGIRIVHEENYLTGDFDIAAAAEVMNQIYEQAVFEWEVTVLPPITVDFDYNNDGMLATPSALLNFSSEMFRINNVADDPSVDYQLFLVDNPDFLPVVRGYMPFGQKYGYVFAEGLTPELVGRIFAHELGHGAFEFEHTASDPENLMYESLNIASKLRKNQWDVIQDH